MDYLEKCFKKNSDIVSRVIDDEVILVPVRHKIGDVNCIYTLDELGAYIWELMDGKRRVKEIKEGIIKEFEVSPEKAEADLIKFLQQLEEAGGIKERH